MEMEKYKEACESIEKGILKHPECDTFKKLGESRAKKVSKVEVTQVFDTVKKFINPIKDPVYRSMLHLYCGLLSRMTREKSLQEIIDGGWVNTVCYSETLKIMKDDFEMEKKKREDEDDEPLVDYGYDHLLEIIKETVQIYEDRMVNGFCEFIQSRNGEKVLEQSLKRENSIYTQNMESFPEELRKGMSCALKGLTSIKEKIVHLIRKIFHVRKLIEQDMNIARKSVSPVLSQYEEHYKEYMEDTKIWSNYLLSFKIKMDRYVFEEYKHLKGDELTKKLEEIEKRQLKEEMAVCTASVTTLCKLIAISFEKYFMFLSRSKKKREKKNPVVKKKVEERIKITRHCEKCPNLQDSTMFIKECKMETVAKVRMMCKEMKDFSNQKKVLVLFTNLLEMSLSKECVLILTEDEIFNAVCKIQLLQKLKQNKFDRLYCILANIVGFVDNFERKDQELIVKRRIKQVIGVCKKVHLNELKIMSSVHLCRFVSNALLWRPKVIKHLLFLIPIMRKKMENEKKYQKTFEYYRLVTVLCNCKTVVIDLLKLGYYQKVMYFSEINSDMTNVSRYSVCANKLLYENQSLFLLNNVENHDKRFTLKEKPNFDCILPIPEFMEKKWKLGNIMKGELCRRPYMSSLEFNGHVMIFRTFEFLASRSLHTVMFSISLYNNEIREIFFVTNNFEKVEKSNFADIIEDLGMDIPAHQKMRSMAPVSDQFLFDVISTARSLTTRKLDPDEMECIQCISIYYRRIKKLVPRLGKSVLDVYLRSLSRKKKENWKRYNLVDCRSILRSISMGGVKASQGDFDMVGLIPPTMSHGGISDTHKLPTPMPKIMKVYLYTLADIMDSLKYERAKGEFNVVQMISMIFKCQSFFYQKQRRNRLANEFLLSSKEIFSKNIVDVPLVVAFLEKSAYRYRLKRLTADFKFISQLNHEYGFLITLYHIYETLLKMVSVQFLPRRLYQEAIIEHLCDFVLLRIKNNQRINGTVLIREVEKWVHKNQNIIPIEKIVSPLQKLVGYSINFIKKNKKDLVKYKKVRYIKRIAGNLEGQIKQRAFKGVKIKNTSCNRCGCSGFNKCGRCKSVFYCTK